jgi:hypothetical protein
MKRSRSSAVSSTIIFVLAGAAAALGASGSGSESNRPEAIASVYVVDFVSTAATGTAMNDAGDVIGTSYPDPGCGSSCLPPLETVVWKGGERIVLPTIPGLTGITVRSLNVDAWIAGFAGFPGTTTHAVVWKPNGNSYAAIDLGFLPGTTSSNAVGIDNFGRAVGWSTTTNFPPLGSPFMWTEAGGMVDLSAQGFPDESPIAISPEGTVGTVTGWYKLDDPASAALLPPPPAGFGLGGEPTAINDAGDMVRFLAETCCQNLVYPFRFDHNLGGWQQISFVPTGHLSSYGVGSINAAQDVTATVQSTAMIAAGPDGMLQDLAPLVSPAYAGSALTTAGPMNASGQILARMIIGQSGQRLVKLVPAQPCTSNCVKVTNIQMRGKGPAFCDQGSAQAQATVTVTNEAGVPLSGVRITGHFFDDYWLDETVSGKTNASGQVKFKHVGPPCVGAIAFLVTNAEARPARTFDRTTGLLTNYVIPLP